MSIAIEIECSIEDAIGPVEEVRAPPSHNCTKNRSCHAPSHRPDPSVYFSEKRHGYTEYEARHEEGTWISYRCKPGEVLVAEWERRMGPVRDSAFGIGDVTARIWPDGEQVLICTSRSMIGSLIFEPKGGS